MAAFGPVAGQLAKEASAVVPVDLQQIYHAKLTQLTKVTILTRFLLTYISSKESGGAFE